MVVLAAERVKISTTERIITAPAKGLIITDFGGTLALGDIALRKASKELVQKEMAKEDIRKLERNLRGNIYDCALRKYWDDYTPNQQMMDIISEAPANGMDVIIMSANIADVKTFVENFLDKYQIKPNLLILRRIEDAIKTDESWKEEMIVRLIKDRPVIDIYEDKIENIRFIIREVGCETESGIISYYHVTPNGILLIESAI